MLADGVGGSEVAEGIGRHDVRGAVAPIDRGGALGERGGSHAWQRCGARHEFLNCFSLLRGVWEGPEFAATAPSLDMRMLVFTAALALAFDSRPHGFASPVPRSSASSSPRAPPPARGATGEHQCCDIAAGDQQHQGDRGHEQRLQAAKLSRRSGVMLESVEHDGAADPALPRAASCLCARLLPWRTLRNRGSCIVACVSQTRRRDR